MAEPLENLTPAQIQLLIARIPELPLQEKVDLLERLEAYDLKNARRRAREDFLVFCHRVYPGFKEGPHHRHLRPLLHDMACADWKGATPPPHALRLTVSMPPRFGKALALDTEIPTPDRGFVRMGDLRVGDKVFAVDGTITEVIGVSPVWRDRPVCRVTTNDGYSVVADRSHEWDVVVDRKRPKWKTVDTEYVLRKTAHTKEARALRIPLQGAAQYPERYFSVDPYVLGVWLGDGRTDSAALCTADDFIFNKVNAIEGDEYTEYAKSGKTRHWRPGPIGKRGDKSSLQTRLRDLGVLNNKHIPQAYMTASVEQRLALLQGLMDTDGAVAKKGCCSFYSTNEILARQVQELVQSLGTKASLASGPATLNRQQFGLCWKVHFFMERAASIPRKAERCRQAARTPERYIRAEAAGVADTVCIEVAHPSHLFLCTRGYIPTHNSESIAFLYVAWYLGRNPSHQVMMITHTEELSAGFGRKVRDLIDMPEYQAIFEGSVQVSKDKSASGNWTTVQKGVYLALGVGGSAAGKGADLLIADDLVSEQAVLYGNPETAFEQAWQYMQVGPLQRLMPGGRIIMIGCLTAETRVLMADGGEKEIKCIRAGDKIATYEDGILTTSEVTNWIEHRPDRVYKIKTTSGKIVRANERHPFLVDRNGSREWVRVRNLKVGDCMVQAVQPQGACDQSKQKGCVTPAINESCGQTDVSACSQAPGIGVSGAESSAQPPGALHQPRQKGCATHATANSTGQRESAAQRLPRSARCIFDTATEFLRRTMTVCWPNKTASVQSARAHQLRKTPGREESQSCTSTIATTPTESGGCSATTATSRSVTLAQQNTSWPQLSTYACTPDPIVEIADDGCEPVYDIEVARTENFIANGLVSHNTRWGKRDPIGRALQWAAENPQSLPWHEVRFPAILNGKSLWPEQWPLEQLLAKKAGMLPQFWQAQYMQEPTAEEGALIKREDWRIWPADKPPPPVDFVLQVWDTAHEIKKKNDYSACQTWGIWFNEETERNEIIILNGFHRRMEFPELKRKAKDEYEYWEPEELIIEKKAAGAPLIQELRTMDIAVTAISPSRGTRMQSNDKYARVNAISAVFRDGCVWAPDTRWAREIIELCAAFPNGEFDDPVDCVEMAISRYRRGGFIRLSDDRREDDNPGIPRRRAYY